jgi:hypothetical protein
MLTRRAFLTRAAVAGCAMAATPRLTWASLAAPGAIPTPQGPPRLTSYPAPRYPDLQPIASVDDLVPRMVHLFRQQPFLEPREGANMNARYAVPAGSAVLVELDEAHHPWVAEAFERAGREVGVRVDVYRRSRRPLNASPLSTADIYGLGDEASRVVRMPERAADPVAAAAIAGRYALLIAGSGGPIQDDARGRYRNEHLQWFTLENWASDEMTFPSELQDLIDQTVFQQIRQCVTVRVTDPEGTDFTFTNYDDGRWNYPSHQWGIPMYVGRQGANSTEPLNAPDLRGVIAGTTDHGGAFPFTRAHLEGSRVVEVEGDGVYADSWRAKLRETKDEIWPNYKDRFGNDAPGTAEWGPGYFWFWECAIGTHLMCYRPKDSLYVYGGPLNNTYERRRSGTIHCGFGLSNDLQMRVSPGDYINHVHIHLMFPTYVGRDAQGNEVTVIDRGHLTALDSPAVRALAARYGDPDVVLAERYFQGIPGINLPGDYLADYGRDPLSYMRRELETLPYRRVQVAF